MKGLIEVRKGVSSPYLAVLIVKTHRFSNIMSNEGKMKECYCRPKPGIAPADWSVFDSTPILKAASIIFTCAIV